MEMEACTVTAGTGTHEFVGSSTNISLIKGKRTKRQRPLSPSPSSAVNNTIITSSSSSASEDDAYATHVVSGGDFGSFSSTTTTYDSTDEEEDMANCLILLAQGHTGAPPLHKFHQIQRQADNNKTEQKGSSSSRIRFDEMAPVSATASKKMGFDIYECKTCNRTFSSFQALGGHRASHKKPKVSSSSSPSSSSSFQEEKKPPAQPDHDFEEAVAHNIKIGPPHQISLQLPSNRSESGSGWGWGWGFNTSLNSKAAKLHECSICGSEFTSGQALGGHMRRHRASTRTSSHQVAAPMDPTEGHTSTAVNLNLRVKPRNVLPLDLNLPAPEEDLRESKFQFMPTQKAMVLSAPALVDCHY